LPLKLKLIILYSVCLFIAGILNLSCNRSHEQVKTLPGEKVAIASYNEILNHLNEVADNDEAEPASLLNASYVSYHYQDYSSTRRFLVKYWQNGGKDPRANYLSGCLALKSGKPDEAVAQAKIAYYHGLTDYDLFNLMASALYHIKKYDSASWAVNIALNEYPTNPETLVLKGNILMAVADSAQALEFLEKGFSLDPGQPQVLNSMVEIYSTLGKWNEAVELLEAKLRESENLNLRKELIAFYIRLRDYHAADSLLEKIPDQGNTFYKNLTSAEIFYNRYRLDSALAYTDKALALLPDDHDGLMMKGRTQTRMGRYYDAFRTFNGLVDRDSTDTEAAQEFEHVKNILTYLNRVNKFKQDSINRTKLQPLENIPMKKPGFN
jgi:tetratricopeptide (TPR) repeat protein